jgi:hypothetical protein
MRLAGIDQSARMKISGHKTSSMEARYNILDDADLKDAATKMNSFLKAQKSAKLKRVKREIHDMIRDTLREAKFTQTSSLQCVT